MFCFLLIEVFFLMCLTKQLRDGARRASRLRVTPTSHQWPRFPWIWVKRQVLQNSLPETLPRVLQIKYPNLCHR